MGHARRALFAAALLPLAACTAPAPAPTPQAGTTACRVTHVVDGDTVHLDCGAGRVKARLLGYDTPEVFSPRCPAEQALGRAATDHLRALVASGPVTAADFRGHDRYGRALVRLAVGGQDVAGAMIDAGYGLPYAGHRHPAWCAIL